ncbi:MAG: mannosyltransferase, partial [Candidatus Saccharibacteria bacterium]|nr:mannosyltransferase [Candidatus Saccharibacteria bacterium]
SRFSTELAKALLKLTPVTFIVSDPKQRDLIDPKASYVLAPVPTPLTEPSMARLMNKYKPDVVFSPLQTFGAAGRTFKLILSSHDMIYYHYRTPPHNLSAAMRAGWFLYHLTYAPQRLNLNSADIVATVSHTTQRDFEKTKLTKRPIVVIPNAPQDLSKYVTKVTQTAAPKNIVYMGSFMPYKNVETLLKGMKWLPDRTLHLMSRVSDKRRAEFDKITPKNAKVIYHNGVSDEEYAKVLANNAILASASLYEGYGLPIAEALALGVPVVVSDIPIFHEVAAGGAIYFNPEDPKDFATRIKEFDIKAVRDQHIKNGKQHISSFTWEASARALLNTIKSIL